MTRIGLNLIGRTARQKAPFPGPHTGGCVLPSRPGPGGCGGAETGHPVPSTSILSSTRQRHCALCSLTIQTRWSSQCGRLQRPLCIETAPSPMLTPRPREPTCQTPALGTSACGPFTVLEEGLKHRASLNHGLPKVGF